ncbi:MAG: TetR/AcrR family transcriptional regulator [Lachnospiraceae bacterium]|nr:TetR/AcrR family transcriptional regulator [Lachnospiraceae bacterium]
MFEKESLNRDLAARYIAEALVRLLKKKNIESISVTEICRMAGVSRMTYYRYFDTKQSILNYYMHEIIEEYLLDNENADSRVDLHDINRIKECFVFFRRYKEFVLCLKKENLSGIMLDGLNKYMDEHAQQVHSTDIRKYQMYYFAGALYNVFMRWLEGGMKESEYEMAQIVVNLTKQL